MRANPGLEALWNWDHPDSDFVPIHIKWRKHKIEGIKYIQRQCLFKSFKYKINQFFPTLSSIFLWAATAIPALSLLFLVGSMTNRSPEKIFHFSTSSMRTAFLWGQTECPSKVFWCCLTLSTYHFFVPFIRLKFRAHVKADSSSVFYWMQVSVIFASLKTPPEQCLKPKLI